MNCIFVLLMRMVQQSKSELTGLQSVNFNLCSEIISFGYPPPLKTFHGCPVVSDSYNFFNVEPTLDNCFIELKSTNLKSSSWVQPIFLHWESRSSLFDWLLFLISWIQIMATTFCQSIFLTYNLIFVETRWRKSQRDLNSWSWEPFSINLVIGHKYSPSL